MEVFEALATRRTAGTFGPGCPPRETIARLIEAATWAPNHRMTQPWRFYVLGPQARQGYAELKAGMKAANVEAESAAAAVREKVLHDTLAIPAFVVVAVEESSDDARVREENLFATFMGIENLLLGAESMGLSGYIHTGSILQRPELRELLGVPASERLVAVLDLGEAADRPAPKPRTPAEELTQWTA